MYVFDNSKWNLFLGWVNDQWLIFKKNSSPLSTVALFNPFTEEDRSYIPTYPQIRYTDYDYRWWGLITFYDPSLNLVAYIGNDDNHNDHLILFNKATRKVLYTSTEIGLSYSPPKWSKNGEYLIYVKDTSDKTLGQWKAELLLVQRDGTEKQLANFSSDYRQYLIGDFSISNNGKKVAFWFSGSKTKDSEMKDTVYIVDLETGQLFDTCLSIYGTEPKFVGWSFDDRYVAITSGGSSTLVDVENREYARINGLTAIGRSK
jgi:Tol biopolymer transport system component